MLYVANWHAVFSKTGYWDLFVAPSPLEHMWSLAIEEQFYLIWPFVAYAVLRTRRGADGPVARGPRRLFVVSVGLAPGVAHGHGRPVVAGDDRAGLPRHRHPGRVDADRRGAGELAGLARPGAIGGGADRGRVAGRGRPAGARRRLGPGRRPDDRPLQGRACSCAGCRWRLSSPPSPIRGRGRWPSMLSIPPLRWLGMISYGLYLWHWPVFIVLDEQRLGLSRWPLFAVRLAVSLVFALASYYALELPDPPATLPGWVPWRTRIGADGVACRRTWAVTVTGWSRCSCRPAGGRPAAPPPPAAGRHGQRGAGVARPGVPRRRRVPSRARRPASCSPATRCRTSWPRRSSPTRTTTASVAANAALPGCRFTPGRVRHARRQGRRGRQWPMCDALWAEAVERVRPDEVFLTVADPGDDPPRGRPAVDHAVRRDLRRLPAGQAARRGRHARRHRRDGRAGHVGARPAELRQRLEPRAPRLLQPLDPSGRRRRPARPPGRRRRVRLPRTARAPTRSTGAPLRLDGLHFVGPAADYVDDWLVPQLDSPS